LSTAEAFLVMSNDVDGDENTMSSPTTGVGARIPSALKALGLMSQRLEEEDEEESEEDSWMGDEEDDMFEE
jgi:hypothetical protein